jgi:hypothetical protein
LWTMKTRKKKVHKIIGEIFKNIEEN